MATPTRRTKRKVAGVCGDGHIRVIEEAVPELAPGAVLIEVHASLVSPGTEVGGWRALAGRRRGGDALRAETNKVTQRSPSPGDGHPTVAPRKVSPPGARPKPFGYSNAGVVLEAGDGVDEFAPGDRVAAIGAGYAMHTDYAVVPHNLCVALPGNVTFEQGSYAMLAATALHALRRGGPEFGESVAVVGLGIVGQLTAMFYHLAGDFVIGLDTIPDRCEIAREWGIDEAVVTGPEVDDVVEAVKRFTNDRGLDAAVIAFGGDATAAMRSVERCMKLSPDGHPMGRVIVVGGARFDYTGALTNIDVRRASRTGAGYHDESWEFGADYPPVFMRWTTRTNLELCVRLISEGRLAVDALTTHKVPLDRVDEEVSKMLDDPDSILGVVFTMAG